jgi:hypothetical protein
VKRDEAQTILLLYRPGTADADDPQIAEALALARADADLARWLAEQGARQEALRAGFRQIAAPAGLKEQIISEQAARERRILARRQNSILAAVAIVVALVVLTPLWVQHHETGETLATYRTRMASIALRNYSMDLVTDDPAAVRTYLAQNGAPADYRLPAALEKTAVSGCAIENWRGTKVSMICFRTGRPLPPGQQSDLWLFVIDRSLVKEAPPAEARQFAQVSRLGTMTWTDGDRLYVLGTAGDESALRRYL